MICFPQEGRQLVSFRTEMHDVSFFARRFNDEDFLPLTLFDEEAAAVPPLVDAAAEVEALCCC